MNGSHFYEKGTVAFCILPWIWDTAAFLGNTCFLKLLAKFVWMF